MLCSASINRAAARSRQVLRYVRRYAHVPALAHELRGIKSVVANDGHLPDPRNLLQQDHRRIALGGARGFPHQARYNQSVAILHQQISTVAQLRLLARAFARQQSVGIGFRFVRLVRTFLATKIHRGVSRIVRWWRTVLAFGLKTLPAGPRFQQRTVHAEVLVRSPSLAPRLP